MSAATKRRQLERKSLEIWNSGFGAFSCLKGGGKAPVDSVFFIRRYFLKETPAFIIFLLILGIPAVGPPVDINHCVSADTRWQLLRQRRERLRSKIQTGLTLPHVKKMGFYTVKRNAGSRDVGSLYTGVNVRVLTFFFFFLPTKLMNKSSGRGGGWRVKLWGWCRRRSEINMSECLWSPAHCASRSDAPVGLRLELAFT